MPISFEVDKFGHSRKSSFVKVSISLDLSAQCTRSNRSSSPPEYLSFAQPRISMTPRRGSIQAPNADIASTNSAINFATGGLPYSWMTGQQSTGQATSAQRPETSGSSNPQNGSVAVPSTQTPRSALSPQSLIGKDVCSDRAASVAAPVLIHDQRTDLTVNSSGVNASETPMETLRANANSERPNSADIQAKRLQDISMSERPHKRVRTEDIHAVPPQGLMSPSPNNGDQPSPVTPNPSFANGTPGAIQSRPATRAQSLPIVQVDTAAASERLRAYVEDAAKQGNLNLAMEQPRCQLLHKALAQNDQMVPIIHQIYCLLTTNSAKVRSLPNMGESQLLGLDIVKAFLYPNIGLPARAINFFSAFPVAPDLLDRVAEYPGICQFLDRLAKNWDPLVQCCRSRKFPPHIEEITRDFEPRSLLVSRLLFNAVHHQIQGGVLFGVDVVFDHHQKSWASRPRPTSPPATSDTFRAQLVELAGTYHTYVQQVMQQWHSGRGHLGSNNTVRNTPVMGHVPSLCTFPSTSENIRQRQSCQPSQQALPLQQPSPSISVTPEVQQPYLQQTQTAALGHFQPSANRNIPQGSSLRWQASPYSSSYSSPSTTPQSMTQGRPRQRQSVTRNNASSISSEHTPGPASRNGKCDLIARL